MISAEMVTVDSPVNRIISTRNRRASLFEACSSAWKKQARASLLRNLVKNGENYLIMGWSMTSFFKLLILWGILGLGMRGILTVPIKQP